MWEPVPCLSDRHVIAQTQQNLTEHVRPMQQKEHKHTEIFLYAEQLVKVPLVWALPYLSQLLTPHHHFYCFTVNGGEGPPTICSIKKLRGNKAVSAECKQRFHSTKSSFLSHQIAISF